MITMEKDKFKKAQEIQQELRFLELTNERLIRTTGNEDSHVDNALVSLLKENPNFRQQIIKQSQQFIHDKYHELTKQFNDL